MRISGQGITGYKNVWVKPDFSPDTLISLKWAQTYSGSYVATDRGATYDVYKTNISVAAREDATTDALGYTGKLESINTLLTDLYANRVVAHADANILYLDWITDNEKIFGADVDYSSGIYAKVISIGPRTQNTWKGFSVNIELIALTPISFMGTHAGAVTFKHVEVGYLADSAYTFQQKEVYLSNPSTVDERSDSGIFEFTATISIADMITFRRTLAYQRGAAITTTAQGVKYPLGPNRSSTWPKNLKYIEVKELGMWGMAYHKVQCRCVEDL